jgi:hypothetical protein|tara:strand:+ start:172 stop:1050 length:879 start_codon:yes stop_codon:yes gene_type:complete
VKKNIPSILHSLLSETTKKRSEKIILSIAIASFVIHLLLIFLVQTNILKLESSLFEGPIAAIYTPFSFILLYEVYLVIYYLPRSITTYIGKQYEIITLIIIRRLFKDLSELKLSTNWFEIKNDLQFTFDIIASVIMFYLLYHFYRQSRPQHSETQKLITSNINSFITLKKIIAASLVPILIIIATYSFSNWAFSLFDLGVMTETSFKDVNDIFFDEFFTLLIVVDVILLLASFYYTDKFHKVIRNSGFIISTILIRLSFSVSGLLNIGLIIGAIVFGLLILIIHNKFEKELN